MIKKVELFGTIAGNSLMFQGNGSVVDDRLKVFDKKRVTVTIEPETKQRTNPQNAYYWKVVLGTFATYTGYEAEELHDFFKQKYLAYSAEVGNINDKALGERWVLKGTITESTTGLSTKEFTDYIEKISRDAAMIGIYIPEPGENYK